MGLEEATKKIQSLEEFIIRLRKLTTAMLLMLATSGTGAVYLWDRFTEEHSMAEQRIEGVIQYAKLWEQCQGAK